MATVREYDVTQTTVGAYTAAWVRERSNTRSHFSSIPTLEEAEAALNMTLDGLDLWGCFNPNSYAKAFPKVPPGDTIIRCESMFSYCSALEVAPELPQFTNLDSVMRGCQNLVVCPVIPKTATVLDSLFKEDTSLTGPASIPKSVTSLRSIYEGCTSLTGEMVVRPTSISSTNRAYAFRDTVKPITLYGNQTLCGYLASTANNGNVTWSAWYDPVPAVTNRGQGSYTTAADLTRMVHNGVLAVDTYAPGRMTYKQGDIVRADEWEALVEAAQTIDPSITLSTHYKNLNKIEAAFDSVL